jgi:hydrogenase expression/formation protein HypD
MKFVDEYRNEKDARTLLQAIEGTVTRAWCLMEVCGGQTHTFVKSGLDRMLPEAITLIHGPGCPVCVTPIDLIDRAVAVARRPEVILASFGDMLRVPGSETDLLAVKATGADVRVVYSPLDAVKLAARHPDREIVFFAVGFETTAPPNVVSVLEARRLALANYSILCAHVRVPPAIEAILGSDGNRVEGFLAAGHVCTVMGYEEYEPIAERYRVPIVVTGFEVLDLLQGIYMAVKALEENRWGVENQYARSVRAEGNRHARGVIEQVLEVCDRQWRGIGVLPRSGFRLRAEFESFDAEKRFGADAIEARESELCIAGAILQGLRKPAECPQFGTGCTPEHPLGAPMVSGEGTCAAYHQYGRKP